MSKLSDRLLQFLAESHQRLNELAGRGTPQQQAAKQIEADLLELVDSCRSSYSDVSNSKMVDATELRAAIKAYCENEEEDDDE